MLAKPLSRVLLFALAGAVLAGAIALKQRAGSRALLNAESNAPITSPGTGEGQRCMSVSGQAAHDPACIKPWRKIQERRTGAGDLASNGSMDSLPQDRSAKRSYLTPEGTVESRSRRKSLASHSIAVVKRRHQGGLT